MEDRVHAPQRQLSKFEQDHAWVSSTLRGRANTALLLPGARVKEAALLAALSDRIYDDALQQNAVPLDGRTSITKRESAV